MPVNCFLPSEDETAININFPDKQESITIDAIDIEELVATCGDVPEDSDLAQEIAIAFKKKYQRTISKNAAVQLWKLAHNILESVKKKLLENRSLSDTTT